MLFTYTAVTKALRKEKSKQNILGTSENPSREYSGVSEHIRLLDYREDTLLTLYVKRLIIHM